jgi:hypothetical protein
VVEEIVEEPVGEFSVELPEFFSGLSTRDKYLYLTGTLKWTPDKANDFIVTL